MTKYQTSPRFVPLSYAESTRFLGVCYLHAAAEAITLVRVHKLETKGREVSLLGEPPMQRARRPTKRSRSAEGIAIPQ